MYKNHAIAKEALTRFNQKQKYTKEKQTGSTEIKTNRLDIKS